MWDQRASINVSAPEGSERIDRSNLASIQDKKIFESSGGDSGFLSGLQNSCDSIESEIDISKDVPSVPEVDKFRDSGAIVGDDDDEQEDNTKDTKQDPMIYRSGIDVGLSEWMCGLNLKTSSSINNLSSTRKPAEESKVSKLSKQAANRPLWEVFYAQDEDGDTHLHLAILGKFQAIWNIIRLAPVPAFLDIRNDDAHSPLHLAVLTRQPEIVRWLLLAGAKGTIHDREGNTPLHLACMNGDAACVDALTRPTTPEELHRFHNYADRIPQVLRPDLDERNYHGIHCVHIAAQKNDIDILRHLVLLGADINAREGKSGYTALHYACENGNEQLVDFLLSECEKLNVETPTYGRLTAYQLAAEQNNHNLMTNLVNYGAELLSPPESDDDYFDSSDDDYECDGSDDCAME